MFWFFVVGRWTAVYLRTCWSADWHVSVQVQVDEADQDVQGLETSHLLSLQHSK